MPTTVENMKFGNFNPKNPDHVYIGRANPRSGLKASKWQNPFKEGKDGSREEIIEKYKKYFWETPALVNSIDELKEKVLFCWCKPLPCHGDFLADVANGLLQKPVSMGEAGKHLGRSNTVSELFTAARRYLEKGFRVVPTVKKASVVQFTELRNLNPHDPVFMKNFKEHPEATGIALIIPENYGVLDLDSSRAEEEFKNIVRGAVGVKTSRGSKYLFEFGFLPECPAKFHIREDAEIILGGMLCELPPGLHTDGKTQYDWIGGADLKFTKSPKTLHDEILRYLVTRKEGKKFAPGELEELMQGVAEGEGRNEAAVRIAGHLIGKGNTWETVETALEGWNRKNKPPMSHKELEGILKSTRKMYDEKQEAEAEKKQAEKTRKDTISLKIQGSLSNPLQIAQALQSIQPLWFDSSKNFWSWNTETCSYERVDETELLCAIADAFNCTIYNKTVRGEVLEALKITGRQRRVKPVKKSWIQFLNGVFDCETGELFEATPGYFFASPIPHKLGDSEETPTIDKLFSDWLNENAQLLHEICAYCLLDDYPIQRIFAFQGSGSNGKSQFIELLQNLLGPANCTATELEKLTQSRFEVSKLLHKKAAFIGDAGYATLTKTHMLKALTGGDLISAEFKGKDSFDFVNSAKICMATNNMPDSADTTDGYYRRWCSVEFKNKFPDGKAITATIPEKEYENLCRKCLKVLKNIIELGSLPHEPPRDQRKLIYESLANPVKAFIEDECETETEESTPIWYLRQKYEEYRERKGRRSLSKDEFSKKLKVLGFDTKLVWFSTEMQQKYTEKASEDRKHWRSIEGLAPIEFGHTDTVNEFKNKGFADNDKFLDGHSCNTEIQSELYIGDGVDFGVTGVTTQPENNSGRMSKNETTNSIGVTKSSSLVTAQEMFESWKKAGVV